MSQPSSAREEPEASSAFPPVSAAEEKSRRRTFLALLVVLIVVVGFGGYLLIFAGANLGSPGGSNSTSRTTCEPVTSPICSPGVESVYGAQAQPLLNPVPAGEPVPINVSLTQNRTSTDYAFWFGDGSTEENTSSRVVHAYASPGLYYIYVQAADTQGQTLSDLGALPLVTVTPAPNASGFGNKVIAQGNVTANTTTRQGASAVLRPGQFVSLEAWVTGPPSDPNASLASPYFTLLGPSARALTLGSPEGNGLGPGTPMVVSVFADSSAAIGAYPVAFVAPTSYQDGGTTLYADSNFTFTIFVGSDVPNHGALPFPVSYPAPPSRGTLTAYELSPGGSVSEDPAIDYETVGYEPILNVYQTLVTYSGSNLGPAASDFVPSLATCVPGSTQCTALYGNDMVDKNGNYTFVINPSAQFYDPITGAHYPVYPSDVLFSLARTCLFSTYPGYQVNPGWILCQSLLPNANVAKQIYKTNPALAPNPAWDGALHYPLNNTPQNILNAITINTTGLCPTGAGGSGFAGDGCVTFHTETLTGTGWSYFLELIGDPEGGAIMPCAWASANGGGLPGFVPSGNDCSVPAANSLNPTAWDGYMSGGSSTSYNTYLQWHMMGSGPYALANIQISEAYYLEANPYWAGTTCLGGAADGCLPGAYSATNPTFIPKVNVIWETSQTQGEAAYKAGTADFASIPSTDTNFALQLQAAGTIGIGAAPSLSIFFLPFNMDFSVSGAQSYITTPINMPSYILQDLNFRQFLTAAFPYGTIQSTVNTVDGIQYFFPYGGAIPQFMGNFYPSNISWPVSDPVTNPNVVGSAAYWWQQTKNDAFFSSLACMKPGAGPCILPLISPAGAPTDDIENTLFANEVFTLTNGAVKVVVKDIPFLNEVINSFSNPGQNPQPIFNLGWAPDYPDPTDYMAPLYQADSAYTFRDAVLEGLTGASPATGLNLTAWALGGPKVGYMSACASGGTLSAPNGWNMIVTLGCQGWAYTALTNLVADGAACAPPSCSLSERTLIYNNAEQIAYKLGLYIYNFQQNTVFSYSTWINPTSFAANPMVLGDGALAWYQVGYWDGGD
jgi:hypothetical protein